MINRLGFNNDGADAVLARLAARAGNGGIVGVNIGANRDAPDRGDDYVRLIETFAPVASYFTVNVSSPNTPGLRDLQQAAALDDLLARVLAARDHAAERAGPIPVLIKIAPDLTLADLDDLVGVARSRGVDGMIVGNTTTGPAATLRDAQAYELGGLSGRPLFQLSTRMLAETFVRVEGQFPLIGVGGIDSGAAAFAKIKAGASLIQLYTGLVFRGLRLVAEIKSDLADFLRLGRYDSARRRGRPRRGGGDGGAVAGVSTVTLCGARVERDPAGLASFLVRPHDDIDVAIKAGEKSHEPIDRVFPEIALEHPGDLRLADAHELAGGGLGQLALMGQPVNLRHDLSLEEVRLRVGQAEIGEDIAAPGVHLNLATWSCHVLSLKRSA